MKNKISTIVFSQGWLDSQIESMVNKAAEKQNEDPIALLIASQIQEQWNIITSAVDDLLKENQEMERRLSIVRSAFL